MDDGNVISRINDLVREEHELRERTAGQGLDESARQRLAALEEALDQCWDLLRQRRAKEEYGENPDEARTRSTTQVEGYLQ
ncbi:MAG TPA: DUF2630 family protein [Actinomycetes bacterium]|nr:DUF2630 family protein [Actinomycetes bacterium]